MKKQSVYYSTSLTICFVSVLLISIPSIDRFILVISGESLLTHIGNSPFIGSGKLLIINSVLASAIFITLALFIIYLKQKNILARSFFTCVLFGFYFVSYVQIFNPIYRNELIQQVQIVNYPSVNYTEIFSKQHITNHKIDSFDDFYTISKSRFNKYETYLIDKFGITDSKKVESIFYLNLVSGT